MGQPPLTAEHVRWAYRLLLDREPESDGAVTEHLAGAASTRALRQNFLTSREFKEKNPGDLFYTAGSAVVLKPLPNGYRIFLDLADLAIGLNVARGAYEPEETAFVEATVRRGESVVDVGANIGYFALVMAARVGETGHVFAFEPADHNTRLLERSLAENRLTGIVTLRKEIVGDRPGHADLVVLPLEENSFNSGGAYLLPPGAAVPPGHQAHRIAMTTLDEQRFASRVSFIKIDVEGAEPLVFRGAERLLREQRPVILSEINPPALRRVAGMSPDEVVRQMAERGYRCSSLSGEPVSASESQATLSVVFRPR